MREIIGKLILSLLFVTLIKSTAAKKIYLTGFDPSVPFSDSLLNRKSLQFSVVSEKTAKEVESRLGLGNLSFRISRVSFRNAASLKSYTTSGTEFVAEIEFQGNPPTIKLLSEALSTTRVELSGSSSETSTSTELTERPRGWHVFEISDTKKDEPKAKVPITGCLNRGHILDDNTCHCPPYYTNFACGILTCANGGYHVSVRLAPQAERCSCPMGYTGPHCEPTICRPRTVPSPTSRARTLFFLINARNSMAEDINQLKAAAPYLVDYFNRTDPHYYDSYSLWHFFALQNGEGAYQRNGHATPRGFLFEVDRALHASTGAPRCKQPLLKMLTQFNFPEHHHSRSPVFVLIDSASEDVAKYERHFITAASTFQTPVFVILTRPPGGTCPIDASGMASYHKIAQLSQGQVIQIPKLEVANLLKKLVPLLHDADIVYQSDACDSGIEHFHVITDPTTRNIAISVAVGASTGTVALEYRDASGQTQHAQPLYEAGAIYLFSISHSTAGAYTFTINRPSAATHCSTRVWLDRPSGIHFGFAQAGKDISRPWPRQGVELSPVMGFTGYASEAVSATLQISGSTHEDTAAAASEGVLRPDCQFSFKFDPISCSAGQTSYATVTAALQDGSTIQRVFIFSCDAPPTCENGGSVILDSKPTCHCAPYFYGERCEKTLCSNDGACSGSPLRPRQPGPCFNGGIYIGSIGVCFCNGSYAGLFCQDAICDRGCNCQPGFTGDHCQIATCPDNQLAPDLSPDFRTLAFLIQLTPSMATDLQQIQNHTSPLFPINSFVDSNQYTQFLIITFDDQNVRAILSTRDVYAFLHGLTNLQVPQQTPSTCPTKIFEALQMATKLHTEDSGLYMVFADTNAQTGITTENLARQLLAKNVEVNMAITQASPCASAITSLETVATVTNGEVFTISKPNVGSVISNYLTTLHGSGLESDTVFQTCRGFGILDIDSQTTAFTVSIFTTDSMASIELRPPFTHTPYAGVKTLIQDTAGGFLQVVRVTNSGTFPKGFVGPWLILPHGSSPTAPNCRVQIRVQSSMQLYGTFSKSAQDHSVDQQASSHLLYMQAALTNHPVKIPRSHSYVILKDRHLVDYGTMVKRPEFCKYPLLSRPINCTAVGPFFKIGVIGFDDELHGFIRLKTGVCSK